MNVNVHRNKQVAKQIQKRLDMQNMIKHIPTDTNIVAEGTKVKLNYESIISEPDYARKTQRYKDFIENNKDKVFTVEYDERFKHNPIFVCLKEDETPAKWIFHGTYDLIII